METIGNKLKAAREKRKMSPEDVTEAIRVKKEYIEAIEKNEFHKLIAPVYARWFIKLYAQCVQLAPSPLLHQFDALEDFGKHVSVKQELRHRKEGFVARQRRRLSAYFITLIDALFKIRLPDIKRLKMPALPSVELPGKKWLSLIIAAAFLIIILSIFLRQLTASDAGIRVPPACRWITVPPEPYLDIPIQNHK